MCGDIPGLPTPLSPTWGSPVVAWSFMGIIRWPLQVEKALKSHRCSFSATKKEQVQLKHQIGIHKNKSVRPSCSFVPKSGPKIAVFLFHINMTSISSQAIMSIFSGDKPKSPNPSESTVHCSIRPVRWFKHVQTPRKVTISDCKSQFLHHLLKIESNFFSFWWLPSGNGTYPWEMIHWARSLPFFRWIRHFLMSNRLTTIFHTSFFKWLWINSYTYPLVN